MCAWVRDIALRLAPAWHSFYSRLLSEFDRRNLFPLALTLLCVCRRLPGPRELLRGQYSTIGAPFDRRHRNAGGEQSCVLPLAIGEQWSCAIISRRSQQFSVSSDFS